MSYGNLSKNFNVREFSCKCCGLTIIEPRLVKLLQQLRDLYNIPMQVNCSTRCYEHNEKIGSNENSLHLCGWAADVTFIGHPMHEFDKSLKKLHDEWQWGGLGTYAAKNFAHFDVGRIRTWEG